MKRRRKRRLWRIRFLALLSVLCLVLCSCQPSSADGEVSPGADDFSAVSGEDGRLLRENYHFLVLGEDRSGKLTDVMMLVSLDTSSRSAAVIQIPRDTYANYTERSYKKLNGAGARLGIDGFRSFLERNMGIRIDRHVILDLKVFSEIVDAVGGVDMDLPSDMTYDDPAQSLHIELKQGRQHLDGALAEQFVRFRSGYLEADLGRMDAQKLFLAAFMDTVKAQMSLPVAVRIIRALYGEVETDLTFLECCALASVLLTADLSGVTLTTLAGEAVRTQAGTWYYVLSRRAAEETLSELFGGSGFDPDRVFTNPDSAAIRRIYEKEYKPQYYRADEIRRDGLQIERKP